MISKSMKPKNEFLLLIFFFVTITSIHGDPILNISRTQVIEESQIPMPDIQYELPETLIGEFIMISHAFKHEITIFPNNKFIALTYVPSHRTYQSYGYVVKINDTWYLSPIPQRGRDNYINRLTEIFLTDSGFSYHLETGRLVTSMRKENIPVPINLYKEITITNRMTKQQYFLFNDPVVERIDFNEMHIIFNDNLYSHCLHIDNGIVQIACVFSIGEELMTFEGFIEKTEENTDGFKGIIRFTNGVPYFYVSDGTAEIEITNDGSIKITMLYTPDLRYMSEVAKELQFPAKLVLEF